VSKQDTERDIDYLRKLSYFYYFSEAVNGLFLAAALLFIGAGRIMMYWGAGSLMLSFVNRGFEDAADTLNDELQIGALFPVVLITGSVFALLALAGLMSGYFAGKYQREQKHHMFCLILAGLTATSVPIGTAFGIPTFILLLRKPVKERFTVNDAVGTASIVPRRLSILSNLFSVYGIVGILLSFAPLVYIVASLALLTGDSDKAIVVRGSMIPWRYLVSGSLMLIFSLALSICTVLAGRYLKKQRAYTFCIVVSALLSLFAPFGTILGVWALFVLFSDPGRAAFRTNE